MPKSWTDQPDLCYGRPIVFRAHFNNVAVEVRHRDDGQYLVTTGNLFGSQTIKVPSANDAFRLLDAISHRSKDEQLTLPEKYEVIPNKEED